MVLMVEQNHGEHLIHRFAEREDVNPFGRGNPRFHDDHYDNPLLTKETESEPIIWDIRDEEEEYPFVTKYLKEESMPVYDTDIEDVIEEEKRFIRKGGFGREEDNIKDIVVVANDLCSSMTQTILSVKFEEDQGLRSSRSNEKKFDVGDINLDATSTRDE
ncbi:hypothetical protein Tco_1296624 [Tanacetum coccineum]